MRKQHRNKLLSLGCMTALTLGLAGTGGAQGTEHENKNPDEFVTISKKPIREYAPDVFKVKVWDEEKERLVVRCMGPNEELFDCNDYLKSLGKHPFNKKDKQKLDKGNGHGLFSVLVALKVDDSQYDPMAFSTRANLPESEKRMAMDHVDGLIDRLLSDAGGPLEIEHVQYEIPAVTINRVPAGQAKKMAKLDYVMRIRVLDKSRKMKPLSTPYGFYWPEFKEWNFGDVYYGTSLQGTKAAKIAVLDANTPYVFPELNMPLDSTDILRVNASCGGWLTNGGLHATKVASVISWTKGGLLYNSRPYWACFSITADSPASFSTHMNWVRQKGVEIANVSLLADKDPWVPPKAVELAYDNMTWLHGRPLFVFAAGNDESDEILQRSWNGVIVGGTWYRDCSWRNPNSLWSDRELPDVVASLEYDLPHVEGDNNVILEFEWSRGTSYAAPVFASLAGLITHRFKLKGYAAPWAETLRAIIYASGEDTTPPAWKYMFPYYWFGYYKDYTRGTGAPRQSNAIDIVENFTWDFVWVSSSSYEYHSQPIQVKSGESIRAAIAWSQPVSCASDFTNCDSLDGELVHDFDLYLQEASGPYGPWVTPSMFLYGRSSFRNDSSWELIDASNLNPSKYYRLRATLSVNGSFKNTYMGIAWRKY